MLDSVFVSWYVELVSVVRSVYTHLVSKCGSESICLLLQYILGKSILVFRCVPIGTLLVCVCRGSYLLWLPLHATQLSYGVGVLCGSGCSVTSVGVWSCGSCLLGLLPFPFPLVVVVVLGSVSWLF